MAKQNAPTPTGKPASADSLDAIRADLAKARAKLEARSEAFDGMRERLEAEFEAKLPTLLSDEQREALDLDGDPLKQWQILNGLHRQYVDEPIEAEREAIDAEENALIEKEGEMSGFEAAAAFQAAHPDADVDALAEFIHQELSPKQQQELYNASEGDQAKFFELAHGKFLESTGQTPPKEGEGESGKEDELDLPTDLSDIPGVSGDVDDESPDDEDDFADVMGMNR